MGIVAPAAIEGVKLRENTDADRAAYERKLLEIQAEGDLFRPEYKDLEFLTHDVILIWRCGAPCGCANRPHQMKVLDWGLMELGRREGWEKARSRLEHLADSSTYDFQLFMGNFRLHMQNFGIIGMWYPKIPRQRPLL
jgi:hypothetical protein